MVRRLKRGGNVLSEASQRALDFMRCLLPEQRRCSRVHLPIRATVVFPDSSDERQTAFLRDVNMLGAFIYCKHKPSIGRTAKLDFALPEASGHARAICEGAIMRVEEFAPGAAIGVAIEFTRYELAQPVKVEQVQSSEEHTPFIGWTVEMVERMFAKSAQWTPPNRECEYAA